MSAGLDMEFWVIVAFRLSGVKLMWVTLVEILSIFGTKLCDHLLTSRNHQSISIPTFIVPQYELFHTGYNACYIQRISMATLER